MTIAATTYIFGIGGSIAIMAGVLSVWKFYRAKMGKGVELVSRSSERQNEPLISAISSVAEDEALRSEFDALKTKLPQSGRDAALESLVREAVRGGDWWLAMEIADAMASNLGKDKALKEIVDAAIVKKEWCLGVLAANKMFYKNFQDQAKQRLVDATGKEGAKPN